MKTSPENARGFLNTERVKKLRAAIAQRRDGPTIQMAYALANEQLLAGHTRDAIAGLEKLRDTLKLTLEPKTKDFFELLAIAYLRLGEQENCNLDPTSICILGELRHTQEEGARKAIAAYEQLLAAFPDDVGSRWLLNVAYMAVGGYPAQVPAKLRVTKLTSGLLFDLSFEASVFGPCQRCLEEARIGLEGESREYQAHLPEPGAEEEMTSVRSGEARPLPT